jgi:hypothetical protein
MSAHYSFMFLAVFRARFTGPEVNGTSLRETMPANGIRIPRKGKSG